MLKLMAEMIYVCTYVDIFLDQMNIRVVIKVVKNKACVAITAKQALLDPLHLHLKMYDQTGTQRRLPSSTYSSISNFTTTERVGE